MQDIKHIRRNFHSVPWVMHAPGFGTWGAGGQKFNFLNMVMVHIKLKGMSCRPGYTEKQLPYDQTGDLGMWSKDQVLLDIFESVGICYGAPSNVF